MREQKNLDAQFPTCSAYFLVEVLDFVASCVDVSFTFWFLLSKETFLMLAWSVFICEFLSQESKLIL